MMNNLSHTIRKFNHFELKYVLTLKQAEQFKTGLRNYLVPDEHGNNNGRYALSSLYYDSPNLRFYYLEINGGYLFVDADGDGLDSNGMGTVNGGVVIVNDPIMNMNGTLDVDGMLVINGGFLVGVGSAGMAQSPSTGSTQYSALQMMPSTQAAGSIVHIESEVGGEIVIFVPTKSYEMVVVSSPELENGGTYLVYTGGSSTGTATDGLYTDGAYSGGT